MWLWSENIIQISFDDFYAVRACPQCSYCQTAMERYRRHKVIKENVHEVL